MADLRLVLLTGNDRRHRYAAARLAAGATLAGVVSEAKAPAVAEPPAIPEERLVLARHLDERAAVETRLLGDVQGFPAVPVRRVERGGVNSPAVLEWLRVLRPDVVVLYGTGIVHASIREAFPNRVVNVHLGLSPYYRGVATNFWPLVEGRPECVGATIHLAAAKVDAGDILAQVRPLPAATDRAHELGTKALIAALDVLVPILDGLLDGRVVPRAQALERGRVYRRADFTTAAVRTLWARLAEGMMPAYVQEAAVRNARYPIVEAPGWASTALEATA